MSHGQGGLVGSAARELIALGTRRHVLKNKDEAIAFGGDVGVPAVGRTDEYRAGNIGVEIDLPGVDPLGDRRGPADFVGRWKFDHQACRRGFGLGVEAKSQSDVLPHLSRSDSLGAETLHHRPRMTALGEHRTEPFGGDLVDLPDQRHFVAHESSCLSLLSWGQCRWVGGRVSWFFILYSKGVWGRNERAGAR